MVRPGWGRNEPVARPGLRPHTWPVSDSATTHRAAAQRHEVAAKNHDRAATFWAEYGDLGRAELQREMAQYERLGAVLESRWAELQHPEPGRPGSNAADEVSTHARQGAKHVSLVLMRTARALERSAELADEHAERREREGSRDEVDEERRVAARTRTAAERARSQAEEWRKISESPRL